MTLVAHAAGQAPGWAFHLLVLLHVICVVGGFGPMVYRSVALDLGRRRGDAAAAGSLAVYGQISGLGEALVYLAGVFGLAAVAAGRTSVSFSKPWVGAAIAVYVVMVGVLHGLVRPAEKKYRATLLALAQEEPVPPPNRPRRCRSSNRSTDGWPPAWVCSTCCCWPPSTSWSSNPELRAATPGFLLGPRLGPPATGRGRGSLAAGTDVLPGPARARDRVAGHSWGAPERRNLARCGPSRRAPLSPSRS